MDDDGGRRIGVIPLVDNDTVPVLDDLADSSLQQFTYEDLKMITDDFSDYNFIGRTQFCKVYRGKIPKAWTNNGLEEEEEQQVVTVKIWADSVDFPGHTEQMRRVNFGANFQRCKDEVKFLSTKDVIVHPNLVKLMGWCCEIENEFLGVVYDLNSCDTLRNLIPEEILKWADRIKIALGIASLLKALHTHQPCYMVLNISAAHIMIDQDCNPVLLEFGMLSNEVHDVRSCFPFGAYGYGDPYSGCMGRGAWTDVYGFGVLLMELLNKHTVDDGGREFNLKKPIHFLHFIVERQYESLRKKAKGGWKVPSGMLVDKSLMEEEADGEFNCHDEALLTMLALECVNWINSDSFPNIRMRPTITEIVSRLKCLYFLGSSSDSEVVEEKKKKKMKKKMCIECLGR